MIIIKTKPQFNPEFVYFLEPIKNNIINEGNFIRIIYSSSIFMLNGVYIMVDINSTNIEKFYNKYKYSFEYFEISRFHGINLFFKIIIDKIFSIVFLIISSPIIIFFMIAVYLEDGFPIFFLQNRKIGRAHV